MNKFFSAYSTPTGINLGLFLIRLIMGVLMALYGYDKLIHFNELAASEFWAKTVNFLGFYGKVPLALTVFAEFFCSILLILGLFTRLSLLVLMFCMAYIFLVVFPMSIIEKGDNGYSISSTFIYFMIYAGLFFTGPGNFSLDYKLFSKRN